jgi:chemotaxis protein CheD
MPESATFHRKLPFFHRRLRELTHAASQKTHDLLTRTVNPRRTVADIDRGRTKRRRPSRATGGTGPTGQGWEVMTTTKTTTNPTAEQTADPQQEQPSGQASAGTTITIDVSDARTSTDPGHVLATRSLGSCIGVCLYDPQARVAGLLHYELPSASIDPAMARERPFMFADTGMTLLLAEMESLGAQKKRIKVKLAGGAETGTCAAGEAATARTPAANAAAMPQIGKRNHAAIRKILWQQGMFIQAEEVGGTDTRTLFLRVADGELTIRSDHPASATAAA